MKSLLNASNMGCSETAKVSGFPDDHSTLICPLHAKKSEALSLRGSPIFPRFGGCHLFSLPQFQVDLI